MKKVHKTGNRSYLNKKFMSSREARPLRILSEYYQPAMEFSNEGVENTIVFFGSSRAMKPSELKFKRNAKNEKSDMSLNKKLSESYRDAAKLAYKLTQWSEGLPKESKKFIICSGGGPGIMEAANRGAYLAKGKSVGLNITLPFEQRPNKYITDKLNFEFHYFFMRKYWFSYLAKAIVIFPGGFGTCDELFEVLTLVQTGKIKRPIPIILYDKKFWNGLIRLETLLEWGTISPKDMDLIYTAEGVDDAYEYMIKKLIELHPFEAEKA